MISERRRKRKIFGSIVRAQCHRSHKNINRFIEEHPSPFSHVCLLAPFIYSTAFCDLGSDHHTLPARRLDLSDLPYTEPPIKQGALKGHAHAILLKHYGSTLNSNGFSQRILGAAAGNGC